MEDKEVVVNQQQASSRILRFAQYAFGSLFTILVVFLCFSNSAEFRDLALSFVNIDNPIVAKNSNQKSLDKEILAIEKRISNLSKRIENLTPFEPYLIVNTTHNNFTLRSRKRVILQNICSTGSYTLLDAGDDKKWVFKTPKGMFHIQGKVADPVWIKPDWAFIEEGLPVPHKGSPLRYEYGTLGDYALSLGKGYLIHGTLYQRFLGLPVTHGCIRLGDDDLEAVYKNLQIGSKVFIY
jgi:hypothetical protein